MTAFLEAIGIFGEMAYSTKRLWLSLFLTTLLFCLYVLSQPLHRRCCHIPGIATNSIHLCLLFVKTH